MQSELGSHYNMVLGIRGDRVSLAITIEMEHRVSRITKWIFPPLNSERRSVKILTKKFSNAKHAIMNKRRTTRICMSAWLLASIQIL